MRWQVWQKFEECGVVHTRRWPQEHAVSDVTLYLWCRLRPLCSGSDWCGETRAKRWKQFQCKAVQWVQQLKNGQEFRVLGDWQVFSWILISNILKNTHRHPCTHTLTVGEVGRSVCLCAFIDWVLGWMFDFNSYRQVWYFMVSWGSLSLMQWVDDSIAQTCSLTGHHLSPSYLLAADTLVSPR